MDFRLNSLGEEEHRVIADRYDRTTRGEYVPKYMYIHCGNLYIFISLRKQSDMNADSKERSEALLYLLIFVNKK